MSDLSWLPRESGIKNHHLWSEEHFSSDAPGVMFEKRPILDPSGNPVDGLFSAWIILNNPKQYNSYTTEMVKGVIAGFHRASADSSVVAAVFTAMGDKSFCTGGNTKEYAEYYAKRPNEYGLYMDLFNAMVDGILGCKKPTICRVNGMRVAGGQEIGMACDLTLSSDLAIFGQAGPRHGSAPDGGSSDFLPWMLPMELAMWNCISCEMWSAYKMKRLGLISKCVPVIKDGDGWVRNPAIETDSYVADGEIVYGEYKTGDAAKQARATIKSAKTDFELLDNEVNRILWTYTNLFPGCLIKSVEGIRLKKKFFWDQAKVINRHWLAANMNGEAFLGFNAFNTKKITGKDTIDFIEYRRRQAAGDAFDVEFMAAVLGRPTT
ncbi:6-oxocyclohex-1-ene-1-carbonyl-CoA hydratase [Desulfosarcina sp.]|uniref:6-oxocyclohex-1-ene-1-carbonyl-CoA hydratase n=1 Tax=Desulfosarcina sp. TaxID=2027861 RepID=UPI0035648955